MTHDNELNEALRRFSHYYGQMPSDDYDFIDTYLRKTETRNISDEGILEIAAIHSNYRDGDGERFSHARIVEFAKDLLSCTRTPPPPSGDAVRLAVEALREAAIELAAPVRSGMIKRLDMALSCDRAVLSLRTLPATPVNPPSAERVEILRRLDKLCPHVYIDNVKVSDQGVNEIRAALSAPVDTGWIDEMRVEVSDEYPCGFRDEGWNAALDAVKQKLDGRGA